MMIYERKIMERIFFELEIKLKWVVESWVTETWVYSDSSFGHECFNKLRFIARKSTNNIVDEVYNR